MGKVFKFSEFVIRVSGVVEYIYTINNFFINTLPKEHRIKIPVLCLLVIRMCVTNELHSSYSISQLSLTTFYHTSRPYRRRLKYHYLRTKIV